MPYKNIEKARQWRRENRIRRSKKYSNPDFSPLQNGLTSSSRKEINDYISKTNKAVPKANRTKNRTSTRKGVYYSNNKHCNKHWIGFMGVKGKVIKKRFNTEEEAIKYREYLEELYFTPEQLKIRDKYTSLNIN